MIKEVVNQKEWDSFVVKNEGHPLQLWGWGELKATNKWKAFRVKIEGDVEGKSDGGAQILTRSLPGIKKNIAYISRGPVGNSSDEVLNQIVEYTRANLNAIMLTIEPHWEQKSFTKGWRHSSNHILIARTMILDLSKTEDELMSDISKKGRQYIRKSSKNIHKIREATTSDEIEKCLVLYHSTAERAGFDLHDDQYYRDVVSKLGSDSRLFAVWNETGEPIAMTWLVTTPAIAFELYGGINKEGSDLRANYALKWHCITTMKREGVREYDFNGLLNEGITSFKKNFSSHENQLVGSWDYPLSPFYFAWTSLLPLFKKIFRASNKIRGK